MPIDISKTRARRIILNCQLLDGRNRPPKGAEGVFDIIDHLGYIQIDTIAAVERAHHQTLKTRHKGYRQDFIDLLHEKERRIFEYWGHARSYLPMKDYRFYRAKMRSFLDDNSGWSEFVKRESGPLVEPVYERIKSEGPLSSKDFKVDPAKKSNKGWGWNPVKGALGILFWSGRLMISGREGFEKRYDLAERVIPDWVDRTEPDDNERGRFFVVRALRAMGIADDKEIVDYIRSAEKSEIRNAVKKMLSSGEVVEVTIDGNDGYFALKNIIENSGGLRKKKPRVAFINPFDNLLIQRERTSRLFDFEYTLECYLPAKKRKHGYFVFPILYGEDMVGRIDPRADRKSKTLVINSLKFEPGFRPDDIFFESFGAAMHDFAEFNSCERVKFVTVTPGKYKSPAGKSIIPL